MTSKVRYCYKADGLISKRYLTSGGEAGAMTSKVRYCYKADGLISKRYLTSGGEAGAMTSKVRYCYKADGLISKRYHIGRRSRNVETKDSPQLSPAARRRCLR